MLFHSGIKNTPEITYVRIPDLGGKLLSAVLVRWKKKPGQRIRKGSAIAQMGSDKATFDCEAPISGCIIARYAKEGTELPVGFAIAAIGQHSNIVAEEPIENRQRLDSFR